MSAVCQACNAPMLWALTPAGKRMPLDFETSEQGTVLVVQPGGIGGLPEPLAITLSGVALILARQQGVLLRTSHFATCPDADSFRNLPA